MKVRAIRIAELGRFREPIAVEGLSGGLNVLVGPNEAGKSTLFRALEFAFFHRHRTARQELVAARPYSGGAPLVEVDFELSGKMWRIRKRYLASQSAELVCRTTGAVARGNDAEETLQRLLADVGVIGGRALLWPKQGELLTSKEFDGAGEDVLRAAIDREIARAAGGEAVRRILKEVKQALGDLVTARQQRPKGRYLAVLDRTERAVTELESARADFAAAELLLERLAEIDAELQKQAHPNMRGALQKRLSDAEDRLRLAQQATAERAAAQLSLSEAQSAYREAAATLAKLDEALADSAKLEQAQRESAAEAAELAERLRAAEAEVQDHETAQVAAREAVAAAEAASQRAAAIVRCKELSSRWERARAAAERIQELQERMAGLPFDRAPIKEARVLSAHIAESAARLEAASAAVIVHYEPGGTDRFKVEGRNVRDGERLLALDRLVLEIPGIGRIDIEPGLSRDRERIEADLARHREALSDLLAAGGVADVEELEARHELARSIAADLEAARAEAKATAPEGLAALEGAMHAVAAEVGGDWDGEANPSDAKELALMLGEQRTRLQAADEALRSVSACRETLKQRIAALDARIGERQLQLSALSAMLPPPEERAAKRELADAMLRRASQALDEALRLERLAASKAPDQDAVGRLKADVTEARDACVRLERTIAALEKDRGRIDGELTARRREDVVGRIAALEAESGQAQSEREDLVDEVQSLQLLEAELEAEEERLRDNYLVPVLMRLGPYIETVFPEAVLTLGSDYAVEALQRGMHAEEFVRLSDGTREQLAVLVRLAFARLLADQRMEMPLILDDALVYSDDERICAMHRALETGAEAHQIIVLTCREQAFSGLHGNRVEMVPWQLVPA
jgi:DNA repair exonuclease SbcCD ATPase subunit